MKNLGWLVLGLGIVALACVLVGVSGGASAWTSGDSYSGSGDWTITNPTVVGDDAGITVNGNLIINARLEVYSSAIYINSGSDNQYAVTVSSTGTLVLYGSTLTASNGAYHYSFKVSGGLDINQSSVSETWGETQTGSFAGGIQILKGGAQVRNSNIYNGRTGGIYIYNAAATITGCNIYNNGEAGASTTYAFGIYMANDGTGTTTSTKVDGNYIYNNYYTSGTYRYGYGIRSQYQSSTDTITNNRIYDNGHYVNGYSQGYQLYLSSSTPTVTDDFLANGSYQLYVTGSSPPQFKNLYISSYAYSGYTSYGVYANNVYLNFSKCTWYMSNGAGTIYGIYASGVSGGSSRLDLTDCTFDYRPAGTSYARYLIYASSYTPINIWGGSYVTMYGSTVQMIYGGSYCPVNINNAAFNMTQNTASPSFIYVSTYSPVTIRSSVFEAVGAWTGSNFFYGTNYCPYSLNDSKVMIRITNVQSSYTFYGFQLRTYEALYLNRTTVDLWLDVLSGSTSPYIYLLYVYNSGVYAYQYMAFNNASITIYHPATYPTSTSYNYIIYTYYTPMFFNNTKIIDMNDNFTYTYLWYAYYPQKIVIDKTTISIHKQRGYYLYAYINGLATTYLTDVYIYNSTIILNNTTPYSVYTSPYVYWYNYYCGHFTLNDSRVELYAGYYIYFYNYGYSSITGKTLYLQNSTLISKNTHVYPNAVTSQYNYIYFYYYNFAYVNNFNLTANSGYYLYFYIYAYYSANDARLVLTNSTFNVDARYSVYPSYWYNYPYLYYYYFIYADVFNVTWNIDSSYYSMIYMYGYSGASTVLHQWNCTYNINATYSQYAPYYYGYAYVYNYYWRNANIHNNLYNLVSMYYCYVMHYGYSGSSTVLLVNNNTYNLNTYPNNLTYYGYSMVYHYYYVYALVENNTYNITTGYYLYNYFYYLNDGIIRNNIYRIKQYVPVYGSVYGYPFYCGGSGLMYNVLFQNNSINYDTYGSSTSSTPYLFYIYYCSVRIENSTINIKNNNGTIPITLFYVYYGSLLQVNNTIINASYGLGSPGGSSPTFPLIYLYNSGSSYPPCTLNITNSTIDVKMYNEAFVHYGFYIYGTNDGLNILNSTVRWNVSSPSTTLQVFRFNEDPSYTGKLNQLSVVGSTLSVDVNAPGSMVSLLRMGGGASIGKTVVSNANLGANFYVASTNPTSLVQLIALKDVVLQDLVLNCNAPPNSDMILNGIRMERSNVEITNIIVKGNGNGRMSGIICDLASTPLIHNVLISKAWAGIQSVFFSRPTITNNVTFLECRAAIYLESNGNVTLSGTTISNCTLGLQLTDGSYATVIDSTFTANTLDMDINGTSTAWLLNSTFTSNKVKFGDDTSILLVNWWLQMKLTWTNAAGVDSGILIPNADLVLNDNTGREYMRTMTDDFGMVGWFTAAEYSEMKAGKTMYSPYKINVNFRGFVGQDSVTVEKSKEVLIHLSDNSLPVVAIVAPDEGRIQNYREVIMQGVCLDLGSGLSTLSFSLDGGAWLNSRPALEAWSQLVVVPEGTHRLGVRVTDMSGNSAETEVGVLIDLTPPEIKVSSPADGSLGNQIGVDLVGTVEKGSVLTVNRRPANVKDEALVGSFSYGVRLVEGKNEFSLFATDRAGNTNSLTWTLMLDITPPPLLLTGPVDGLLTNQKTVSVTGKTEPGAALKLNDAAIEAAADGSFTVSLDLKFGANTITVVASDIAGNTASQMRTVIMDNEIGLSLAYPGENLVTNQITILARGTTDNDVLLRLNDGLVTVASDGNFSVTYTLNEGPNELVFSAVDRAGNSALVTRRVILDTSRPTLEILSPQAGTILRTRDVTVNGSCEPGITLTVNGESVPTDTGLFSKTLTLPEGNSIITIEGRDAAGNTVSSQIPVLIDLTAPSLEIVEPTDGFRTRDLSVMVVGITEPGALVTVNGLSVMVDPFGKFTTTVTLQKGDNTVKVVSGDNAGNSVSKSIVVKETTDPAKVAETNWWWAALGLALALGIMLPLTALLATVAVKGRKGQEGAK